MTTSPLTNHQIEDVFGDSDQLPELAPAPANAVEEWSRFGAFLRRPALPEGLTGGWTSAKAVLRMFALDMMVMIVLLSAIAGAGAMGFEMPKNVNNELGLTAGAVLLVVVGAPLAEEILFRGWLTGRPAVMAGLAIAVFGAVLAGAGGASDVIALAFAGFAIALIGAPLVAYLLLKKPTPALFKRGFAVFYWLSCVGFALVHFANYTEGALWVILPLLLPQLSLGTMLGYLRVHYGLVQAIALHALHNGVLFGLAMAGKYAAENMPAPA